MREGVTYKRLGDLVTVINGLWTGKRPPFVNVAVIRNTNFTKNCTLDLKNVAYIDVEEKQFYSRKLEYGDIIIEKSGGSDKQPVGRPIFFDVQDGDYSFSNFTSTLRVIDKNEIEPRYLQKCLHALYLQGMTRPIQSKTTGLHNLDFHAFLNFRIIVPSLDEQQRIVSELDRLASIISDKQQQLHELDNLAQAIFYSMFGDPLTNPKGWEMKKLGDICDTTSGGTPKTTHKEYYDGGTIPWLRSGEVAQGLIKETELFITQAGLENSSAKIVPVNTVSIAMYGATVGAVGIIQTPMCTNQAVCNILPTDEIAPTYLMYFLIGMKPRYISVAAGGAQPNISQTVVRDTAVMLPPLDLQQQFAEKVKTIEGQKDVLKQSIAEFENLLAQRMEYHFA